jgi:TonB family protein
MKTVATFSLLTCVLCSSLACHGEDLEAALAQKYENTIVILRHPVTSDSQRYNAAGELLSQGSEGPWTVYGGIEISKVHLSPAQLSIEGKRRVYGFDSGRNRLLPVKIKEKNKIRVQLKIALDSPLSDIDQANAIIHRILTTSEQELITVVPDYWRPFLIKQYGPPKGDNPTSGKNDPNTSVPMALASPAPLFAPDDVVQLGKVALKAVRPPQPVFTPQPEFPDAAKHFKFHGIVTLTAIIDTNGRVNRPKILRPAGLGLDEQAIRTVLTWKFKPALRNGEPVAVAMALEIAFNLY